MLSCMRHGEIYVHTMHTTMTHIINKLCIFYEQKQKMVYTCVIDVIVGVGISHALENSNV